MNEARLAYLAGLGTGALIGALVAVFVIGLLVRRPARSAPTAPPVPDPTSRSAPGLDVIEAAEAIVRAAAHDGDAP